MNQTPAAILIMAASVCAHSVASRDNYDSFTAMIGIAAVALALWGVASLLQQLGPREDSPPEMSNAGSRRAAQPSFATAQGCLVEAETATTEIPLPGNQDLPDDFQLSPEVSAQLAVVAHQMGKPRMQVVDDVLRKHLPRYTTHRVA